MFNFIHLSLMTLSDFLLLQNSQNMIPETMRRMKLRMGARMTSTRVPDDRPGVTDRDYHNQVIVQTSVHLLGALTMDVTHSVIAAF